jgi:hypothetical protein
VEAEKRGDDGARSLLRRRGRGAEERVLVWGRRHAQGVRPGPGVAVGRQGPLRQGRAGANGWAPATVPGGTNQ